MAPTTKDSYLAASSVAQHKTLIQTFLVQDFFFQKPYTTTLAVTFLIVALLSKMAKKVGFLDTFS